MDGQFSFDLNEVPMDDDAIFVECGEKSDSGRNEFDPFIGQCFLSEEEAFIFYKNYAFRHGFSIRKARSLKKNGELKRRDFCCQCEGKPALKLVDPFKQQRNRQSVKCECKARICITLRTSCDIFLEEWQIVACVKEHNHELLAPSEVRFLSAYRTITKKDQDRILLLKEGGLTVRQIMRVMELEQNIDHGLLPFIEKDVRNLFTRIRKQDEVNDATHILRYCELSKEENCKFRYAFTLDDQRKLEHIFWSSAHCFEWYQRFGDVVVFDTTYKINAYEMPFGIFVGVNNHGKTVLFGCALLRNETTSAFQWLFKVISKKLYFSSCQM